MAVGVRVRAGRGVVDPVQDDEGHAADHHQEATEQEGGSLERRAVGRDTLALTQMITTCAVLVAPPPHLHGCKDLTPIFCTDFMDSFLTSLM